MKRSAIVCAIVGIYSLSTPAGSTAGSATDEIRATHERVQSLLQDPRFKTESRKKERQAKLRQTLARRFDFPEMAKRSLGPVWQVRTKQERTEFVKVFTDLVEASYMGQIDPFLGEDFVFLRENRDGDFSEVATKVIPLKGNEFAVNYKMRFHKGDWRIYDVVVENVSVVNNYRSQFNRILAGESFEDLLKRMRETKLKQAQAKNSRPDSTIVSYWLLAQASPARLR